MSAKLTHGAGPEEMTQEVDPAGDESRTLYDVLLVHPRAPECVIQAAYRALARLHHPDVSPSEADAERMREINAAHTVLSDPKRRAEYDLSLLQRSTSGGGTPRRAGARRERGCWKCGRPLDLLAPYCGACRWVVCAGCKTCGCTHPSRRQAQEKERISRKGRVVVVGLVVAAALVVLNRSPQIADRKASSAPAATAVVATATAAPAPVVTTITSGASNGAAPATSEADRQLGTPLSGAPFLNDPSSTPPPTATRATAAPTSPVVEMADGGASGSDGIASSVLPPNPAADVIPTAPPVATAAPTANASVAPTPAEESRSSRVATGGLGARVRAEPDPIAPILVVLVDGTRVTELGLEEARGGRTWREIRTPGGATGWIDTNLLARAD